MKRPYLHAAVAWAIAAQSFAALGASEGDDPGSDSAPQLEEVIVTAQRRSENLQRAAVAVSSVDGDKIRELSIVNPTQLTGIVPSLQVAPSNSSFNYYLRGVGNVNGNALSESAIAFNYAGVYIGRPASTASFFYDLERVEVLKGPQGTLYGRNATGGAINVIPKAPTSELEGNVSVEYGNYDTLNAQGAFNIPLSSTVAVRAAGFVARHDGYLDDGTDDQDDYGGRIQVRIEPTDDLSIDVLADYASQGGQGAGATPVPLELDRRDGVSSEAGQAYYQAQLHTLGGRNFAGLPPVQYQKNDFAGLTSTVDWQADLGTFTLVSAYRRSRINAQSSNVGFVLTEQDTTKEKSVEARFASDEANPVQLLVGGYYYDLDIDSPLFLVNNQFDYTRQAFSTGTSSQAGFGRLTYKVTPDLRVVGGLRYTRERKELRGDDMILDRVCLGGFGACPNAVPFAFGDLTQPDVTVLPSGVVVPQLRSDGTLQVGTLIHVDQEVEFDRFTWRGGVDWDVTPSNFLYASYETGFKSGGFYFTHDEGIYKPEKIWAATVGSKNQFAGNQIQINVEAFYWIYTDQQISHVALDSAGTAVLPTENVGKATMRGVEAEARWLVTPSTLTALDVLYLDAKYDEFVYSVPNFGAPPSTTCPATLTGVNYSVDCSGNRPPQAPQWTVNLNIEHTLDLANAAELVLAARAHYQTETLTSLEFLPDEYQDAYTTFDAAVTYKSRSGFEAGAFVNNLTDRTIMGGSFIPPFSANSFVVGMLRPPRVYGVRLGYSF